MREIKIEFTVDKEDFKVGHQLEFIYISGCGSTTIIPNEHDRGYRGIYTGTIKEAVHLYYYLLTRARLFKNKDAEDVANQVLEEICGE